MKITFRKIRTFITIVFSIIATAICITLTIIAERQSINAMENEIKRNLTQQAETIASEIHQIVTFRYRQLNMTKNLEKYVTNEKFSELFEEYKRVISGDETIYYLILANTQGHAITSNNKTTDVSNLESFKEAIKGNNAKPILVKDPDSGKMDMIYSTPCYNKEGLLYAAMSLVADGLVLSHYMEEIPIGKEHPFIIDTNGNLIAHKDISLIENQTNLITQNTANSNFIKQICYKNDVGFGEYTDNGIKKFAGFFPIPETNWIVVAPMDRKEAMQDIVKMTTILALVCLLAIAIIFFATYKIAKMISKPVSFIADAVECISQGDLVLENFPVETRQKIMERTDELGLLGRSLTDLVMGLTKIVEDIKNASEKVSLGAGQMSSSSQLVSSGASEQAASTEEISATMEEITSNIKQNTENAITTAKIAQESAEKGNKSAQSVIQTVGAMQEITSKISIINAIASQTNLLALNAAIEAARAGEAGKGFSVVASEIRQLAEKSQNAAADISEVAKSSSEIAEESGILISDLIPEIQRTEELVEEIAAASKEQNTGVQQINRAILQMDQVVQQNASASEELAAMAEELNIQAQKLIEIIKYFKIAEN
ncbi:MAG: HAMP domain-containing protein [Spirochaetaceae bacterium]|nr:HAMP domain-containing protein [Spirochaetaceae bacterium]